MDKTQHNIFLNIFRRLLVLLQLIFPNMLLCNRHHYKFHRYKNMKFYIDCYLHILHHLFQKLQPGGFILFTRNIVDPWQTRQLTDSLRELCEETPLIAIDNEGGRVWRTAPFSPASPSAAILSGQNDPKPIAQAGWITGRLLSLLGINLNLAPVLDLDHHPNSSNALNERCWGISEQDVINHAGVFNRWQRRQGIAGCAKHFPCGGRAANDPHHTLPIVAIGSEEILRKTSSLTRRSCPNWMLS